MISKIRDAYQHLRVNGYIRGSVIVPALLVVAFVAVLCWGFYVTGEYDVERSYVDAGGGGQVNTSSTFTQRLWATLGLFTGAYIALHPDWDPMPPPHLSAVGILATLLTLLTAGSLVLISRRARDFLRTIRPRTRLVVIGNGDSAAGLVTSSIEHKIATILITDSRESKAARATKPSIPIIAAGQIDSALSTPSARRVIANAHHIVVATDFDGVNVQLHSRIHEIRERQQKHQPSRARKAGTRNLPPGQPVPKDLVVIHDPEYAELLRPTVIREVLPDREVTCPTENIAEHVCHLIVAAATGGPGVSSVHVSVTAVDSADSDGPTKTPAPLLKPTLESWVQRLSWVLGAVKGAEGRDAQDNRTYETVPTIVADPVEAELRIEIITGSSASAVAKRALTQTTPGLLQIAVANEPLMAFASTLRQPSPDDPEVISGKQWLAGGAPMPTVDERNRSLLLVVDPEKVGLDAGLVTDDTGTQWARTFDLTHGLMFSDGNYSVTGWQPNAPMGDSTTEQVDKAISKLGTNPSQDAREAAATKARKQISDRYSSKLAVEHMLVLLAQRGYELRHCDGQPRIIEFSDEDVEYIAKREHHHWLDRKWSDTSGPNRHKPKIEMVAGYSGSRADNYCYQGLVTLELADTVPNERLRFAAEYNRRIARETYPAIAASFGYAIVASTERTDGAADLDDCTMATCVCGNALRHRAKPQTEPATASITPI